MHRRALRFLALAALLVLATPPLTPAADPASARKSQSFTDTVRSYRRGVFVVGYTDGGHGTAWVLSRKHRLLVTNAHVADIFAMAKAAGKPCEAVMNLTNERYRVARVWYHPGVRRYPTPEEKLSVRAMATTAWPVCPASPDVAVLQLTADGPELTVEFPLAAPDTIHDLQTLPVGILGFPGHDTAEFPRPGEQAEATFHEGVVSRATDFALKAATPERAQCLQYTITTFSGFSGSPLFLKSGEVIGLHNSSRTIAGRVIANGVRVDLLWELLTHNRLTNLVPVPVSAERLDLQRWYDPDPGNLLYARLYKLVDEAKDLIYNQLQYQAGIDRATQAITLFPDYAPAYRTRADGYNNWYFRRGDQLSAEQQAELLLKALGDAERNVALLRDAKALDSVVDAARSRAVILNNLGHLTRERKYNQQALNTAEDILKIKGVSQHQRASALSMMAIALAHLDRAEDARQKHVAAVQLNPDEPVLWENRAGFFDSRDAALARADRDMAHQLRKRDILVRRHGRAVQKVVSQVDSKLTPQDPSDGRSCHYHHWSVELEAGYYYQIDLKSPGFAKGSEYDPILRLYDPTGRLLREDDDGGGFPHARIFVTPTAAGTYQLVVTSYVARQTGQYLLTVRRIAEDK